MCVEVSNRDSACDEYQVTVTNVGAVPTTVPPVTVRDALPAGLRVQRCKELSQKCSQCSKCLWCREGACTEPHTLTPNAFIDCVGRVDVRCLCVPVDVEVITVPSVINVVSVFGGGVTGEGRGGVLISSQSKLLLEDSDSSRGFSLFRSNNAVSFDPRRRRGGYAGWGAPV